VLADSCAPTRPHVFLLVRVRIIQPAEWLFTVVAWTITKKVSMTKAAEDKASGSRDDSATEVEDSLTNIELEPEAIAEVTGDVVGARPTYWKLCSENERYRWFLVSYVVTQLGE
jgi:hypothetical protein